MEFHLSEEQQELAEFVSELLRERSSSSNVRKVIESSEPYDLALWQILCEQIGAASLAIPEEYGGAGFTAQETHLVLEALGYALTPSPFLGSVCIAAQAIVESKNTEISQELLPSIADGSAIATLAWATPTGTWNPAAVAVDATPTTDGWKLTGEIPYVLDGAFADTVLVIAQTAEGPAIFALDDIPNAVDSGTFKRVATSTLDQTSSLATLNFGGASAKFIASGAEYFEACYLHAITALSAYQVGSASRGLTDTVEYTKQREQFGRQIGSFQALKHRMADMHVSLEKARTTMLAATWAESHPRDSSRAQWPQLAHLAQASASDALNLIASEMIQLHGGIAITWEHDAHLVFKRAHFTSQLFGNADIQREHYARVVGL